MNDLIERLAEQCYEHDQSWTGVGQRIFNKEKFAELLINECIDKISKEQDLAEQNWQCKNGVHICHELTKHFGVKE